MQILKNIEHFFRYIISNSPNNIHDKQSCNVKFQLKRIYFDLFFIYFELFSI